MQEWVDIISQIGFPMVVAGWFMIRADKRQDEIIKLLQLLVNKDASDE